MMKNKHRNLKPDEVKLLELQGCTSSDWSKVQTSDPFNSARIKNVRFSGDIKLGTFQGETEFFGGFSLPTGIENAALHNCRVGDDVFIRNIGSYISNYRIEDRAVIDDVQIIAVEGLATFGNGVRVQVINEAGGRELPIYNHLSSHIAYLLALYRHDEELLEKLESLVSDYVEKHTYKEGEIGAGARLLNCGIIKNVTIGGHALVQGTSILENGTILSKESAPSRVGSNVIARDFIFSTDSRVSENTIICKCFVGQATELGRQYSAENSVFFANCAGFHGEACAIFAGPYTVTHHKSTLLIAGLYSFMNAGSGSNQSNHMYKLGPVHQGIVERGSKTSSDSYMLWPMRVGAFTLVMGRHTGNSDTTDLPFSYLIEDGGESILVPAVNLRSVGTIRDSKKWPRRDKRRDENKTEFLTFHLLTPYTGEKILRGIKLLEEIRDNAGFSSQTFYYNGVKIRRSALQKGLEIYRLAMKRYLGNVVVSVLRQGAITSRAELSSRFELKEPHGAGSWMDLAGLYLPKFVEDEFLSDLKSGQLGSMKEIHDRLGEYHELFEDYELAWVNQVFVDERGVALKDFTSENFCELISEWIMAVEKLDRMRCEDAEKEFFHTSKMGFGIDGDSDVQDADFKAVRGSAEENDFIMELKERLILKKQSAKQLIDLFSNL
ncbi:MAG: DUF4954 family protein [Spirochaetales bacterium]|nr:DUF4954 family protein [Spirochaetales bacterium]